MKQTSSLDVLDKPKVKKEKILKRTRSANVNVLKRVPICTQSNHNIVAVQSKFDEIQCVCKMKYEMRE